MSKVFPRTGGCKPTIWGSHYSALLETLNWGAAQEAPPNDNPQIEQEKYVMVVVLTHERTCEGS